MKKWLIGIILLVFTGIDVFAQLPENRMIWGERPLSWGNFKGSTDSGNPFDANTNSGISYSWSVRASKDTTKFLYRVEAYFYPDLSWVKPEKKSDELLAHEQLHFDITELHARKLRKAMEGYKLPEEDKIKKELKKIYEEIERSRTDMQEKYDRETRHSQDTTAQRKWQTFLRSELEKLKAFSS